MFRPRMTELRWIALAVLAAWGASGLAAGLGPIRVQSELGQPLRASVTLLGEDADEFAAHCIKARVESSDGLFIVTPQIGVTHGQPTTVQLSSRVGINEPAIVIQLGIGCTTPVNRTYQILLDPVVIAPPVVEVQQSKPAPKVLALSVRPAGTVTEQAVPTGKKRRIPKAEQMEPTAALEAIIDAAPMLPKVEEPQPSPKVKKATRNVLKLSGNDIPVVTENIPPRLRMTDSLSIMVTEADPQKLAEVRAAQAHFAAVMRNENLVQSSEERVKSAQTELQALKAQLVMLQSDSFSFNWVAGLGAVLLACLAAIIWLLWRFYDIQKTSSRSAWGKDAVELKPEPTNLGSFETGTAFGNAAFNTTAFGETEFGDTLPIETDCDKITHSIENLPTIIDLNPSSGFLLDEPERPPAPMTSPSPADKNLSISGRRDERREWPKQTAAPNTIDPLADAEAQGSSDELALKAEEITDALQLAELWVSLNDPKRALQILEPFSELEQPESPAPWIYLLGLYRVTGNQAKYESVQRRIKRSFNAKILPWGVEETSTAALRTLEDYPHIVEAICGRWDGNDIVPYLESLLLDSRDGARDGFDLSVYRDIIQLISLASEPDPVARKKHMNFGQAHTILFRRRAQNEAAAAHALAPALSSVRIVPEKSPAARTPHAGTPAKSPASGKIAADENMGVPEMKLAGQSNASNLPYLKEEMPSDPFGSEPVAKQLPPRPKQVRNESPNRKPSADIATPAAPTIRSRPKAAALTVPQAPAAVTAVPSAAALTSVPETEAAQLPPRKEEGDHLMRSLEVHIDEDDSSVMATKLHLAIAYQDIGEKDGARLLLEEVIRGGMPDQSEKARMILAILARGEE